MTLRRLRVTHAVTFKLTSDGELCVVADAAEELRAIRLWHWGLATRFAAHAEWAESAGKPAASIRSKRDISSQHMRMVQTLNQFFDIGDTAEKDAEK